MSFVTSNFSYDPDADNTIVDVTDSDAMLALPGPAIGQIVRWEDGSMHQYNAPDATVVAVSVVGGDFPGIYTARGVYNGLQFFNRLDVEEDSTVILALAYSGLNWEFWGDDGLVATAFEQSGTTPAGFTFKVNEEDEELYPVTMADVTQGELDAAVTVTGAADVSINRRYEVSGTNDGFYNYSTGGVFFKWEVIQWTIEGSDVLVGAQAAFPWEADWSANNPAPVVIRNNNVLANWESVNPYNALVPAEQVTEWDTAQAFVDAAVAAIIDDAWGNALVDVPVPTHTILDAADNTAMYALDPEIGQLVRTGSGAIYTYRPAVDVSGAGTEEANGAYTWRGDYNDHPYYGLVGVSDEDVNPNVSGANAFVYTNNKFTLTDSTTNDMYEGTDVAFPWLAVWSESDNGVAPVPTVVLQTAEPSLNWILVANPAFNATVPAPYTESPGAQALVDGTLNGLDNDSVILFESEPDNFILIPNPETYAAIPMDAPITPPQAFVDVMSYLNTSWRQIGNTTIDLSGKNITEITDTTWLMGAVVLTGEAWGDPIVNLSDNKLNVASVDLVLADLVDLGISGGSYSLDLSGQTPPAPPTPNVAYESSFVLQNYFETGSDNGKPIYQTLAGDYRFRYNGTNWLHEAESSGWNLDEASTGDGENHPWEAPWSGISVTPKNTDVLNLQSNGYTVTTD